MNHFISPLNTYVLQDAAGNQVLFGHDDATIAGAHSFMRLVLTTTMQAFQLDRRMRIRQTRLGKHLHALGAYSEIYSPHRQFEPQLKLFLGLYKNHRIALCEGLAADAVVSPGETVASVFERFVADLRDAARAQRVRKKQADWESKYRKNAKRLLKLEKASFRACPEVVVVFMHFHLREWILPPEQLDRHHEAVTRARFQNAHQYQHASELAWETLPRGAASFEDLQRARQRFLGNAKGRPTVFRGLLGVAWRQQFAPAAGHHMHAVFFFDGSVVHDHVDLGHRIGEFWQAVTDDRGLFRNGNAGLEDDNFKWGVGRIGQLDLAKRKNLRRLLDSMTQVEMVTAPLPHPTANMFATSELPKRPPPQGLDHQHGKCEQSTSKIVIRQRNQRASRTRQFSRAVVGEGAPRW